MFSEGGWEVLLLGIDKLKQSTDSLALRGSAFSSKTLCIFYSFPEFQDVQVIVFLGFGFLGSYLVRYGFSSIGFNLLVAAVATQWAIVLNGMESWYYRGKVSISLRRWVVLLLNLPCLTCIHGVTDPYTVSW